MRSCHHFRIFDSVQLFSGSLCDRGSPAPQSKCPNRSAIMWCLTPPHRSNSSNTIERACSIRCRHSNSSNCFVISPKRLVRIRSCHSTLLCPSLCFLEFSVHRRVMDSQVCHALLQSIPMLSIRLGDPGFPIFCKSRRLYFLNVGGCVQAKP